ncbi:NUDIX domain-containing protein [bacterium]|nr:NUDIX domain-containing protein [bacterium]
MARTTAAPDAIETARKRAPASLLRWYRKRGRDLPWRHTRDPYRIWVSETMLQQTVVETVIPYYERFLARFPDVRALAASANDDVLAVWQGLGYYRRAIHLRRAAHVLVAEHGGVLPRDEAALRALPGIGAYTAAAVAAIAFNSRTLPIDALIRRVAFRVLGLKGAGDDRRMREDALFLISKRTPGDSVQALMDLATAICRPVNPLCDECPISRACVAFSNGTSDVRPAKPKPKIEAIDVAVGILVRGDTVLLQRRAEDGLFAGLWELPGGKVEPGETASEAVVREFREEVGRTVRIVGELAPVRHAYTRFRVTLYPFIVHARKMAPEHDGRRHVPIADVARFPQPAANVTIWRLFHAWRENAISRRMR